jgi:hypothetical protein
MPDPCADDGVLSILLSTTPCERKLEDDFLFVYSVRQHYMLTRRMEMTISISKRGCLYSLYGRTGADQEDCELPASDET